ncbi:MAG TPA: hypothetical protein VM489_16695, partial [Burkholderiales bacterium]|nr:hypothetical protein [Burkholderiales bacterium]
PTQTPNVAVGAGQVMVFPFHFSRQFTATVANVARFQMPQPCQLIGAGASARASGGTSPTLTIDVLAGGTSVLASPIPVTAGAFTHGAIKTDTIADEAVITVSFAIGGTSPTWDDPVLLLTCARR